MKVPEQVLYLLQKTFWKVVDTEWSENWGAWPHCNGQARCWTHTESCWCDCACRWCRMARRVRPNYHRSSAN